MRRGLGRIKDVQRPLPANKLAQLGELVGVFVPAFGVILLVLPFIGDSPLARQSAVFLANLMMLVLVWLGLRMRGQDCRHFGLSFRPASWRTVTRAILQSLVVFVVAVGAVVLGAVTMASILGRPESADMSGYDFLRGNLLMLVLILAGVYLNASFGEEVIYRAFLITRIAELGSGSKTAWRLGVLLSSLVFGLIHSDWALVGMVQMAFMGLVLGVSYLVVGRNLWVTILAHGYADTLPDGTDVSRRRCRQRLK